MKVLDSVKQDYLENTFVKVEGSLKELQEDLYYIKEPEQLIEYTRYLKALESLKERTLAVSLSLDATEIKSKLLEKFKAAIDEYNEKIVALSDKYEGLIAEKQKELEEEAKFHNKQVSEEWARKNQVYIDLEAKRKRLERYAPEIEKICDAYGILSSDVDIDNSSFTINELSSIYDKYIQFMEAKKNTGNPIRVFRKKVTNTYVQGAVLLGILLLCFTSVLDVIAVAFYSVLVYKQFTIKKKVKSYIVLYGLIYNVQPLNMGFKGEIDKSLMVNETIDSETDKRFEVYAEEWSEEMEKLDEQDPEIEKEKALAEYVSALPSIQAEFDKKIEYVENIKKNIVTIVDERVAKAEADFKKAKSEQKYLGQSYSKDFCFDTKFRLGLKDGVIEEIMDLGMQNIIIRPSKDEERMTQFLQVMLANALLNVCYGKLTVHVVDPNGRSSIFMSFYDDEFKDILQLNTTDLNKLLEELDEFLDSNMKEMKGRKIQEFNKIAQEQNSTPREYRLLIVLSQPDELEKKEEMVKMMETSAEYGVFIWAVGDMNAKNTRVFDKPFAGVESPYTVDVNTFGRMVAGTLKRSKEDNKLPPFFWSDFMDNILPEDKIWTYEASDVVSLMPGYYEGDPNDARAFTFGNKGNVHMLAVGGTGAGKSVFLNMTVLTLCSMYSPKEIELWMVDFKGAEFQKYIASPLNDYKALPHIKACLCTSDGDYAGSLYKAVRKISEDRYQIFKEWGCKNLKEFNAKVVRAGKPELKMPRLVLINDEFQVIYEKADDKIITEINKDITYVAKVGRASGVHLFFTSQSMKGTVKDDILQQFTLRFVLRCDVAVSQQVLGTNHSGLIKEANGYLYVRSQGIDLNHPLRFRTPFIDDEPPMDKATGKLTGEPSELQKAINDIYDRAVSIGFKQDNVITYDENTKHSIEEINAFYETNKSRIGKSGESVMKDVIVLGRRMTYSPLTSPENIILDTKNNMHIFSIFNNYNDLVNFYKTIKFNLDNAVQPVDIIANSQVADFHYLCELDKDISGDLAMFSTEKTNINNIFALVDTIYQGRKRDGYKDKPLYVILIGWDKASGFGIDRDSRLTNNFNVLLQQCSEFNIHFIFICNSKGQISPAIISACKFQICGKCSEDDSMAILSTKQAFKSEMKDGFMYINKGGSISRAKLYQYKQEREAAKTELDF